MDIAIIVIAVIAIAALSWFYYRASQAGAKKDEEIKQLTSVKASLAAINGQQSKQIDDLNGTIASLNVKIDESANAIAAAQVENAKLQEQVKILGETQAKLKEDSKLVFKDVATALLQEQGRTIKESNETRLNEILAPFKENLEGFKKKIDDYNEKQIRDNTSLQEQIKNLSEMNRNIGKEAKELTEALRGNSKVQGDWGEMLLEQILQNGGMEKGIHYITQATNVDGEDVRSEGGTAQRPDVVLLMPDKKNLVIDSKVSLTDYANMIAATTEEERKKAEKDHFNSVKRHVDELSEKKYQEKVKNSADFVMMFIPNEAAYMQAMHHDSNLWDYAYKRQVVIISPTHLISVVRLMHQLWSREMQAKNALAIAEEAGKMYDKFAGFVDDFQKIGSTIESVGKVYDQAWNKLSSGKGNLLSKAEKLKSMGIKATKQLPESNEE